MRTLCNNIVTGIGDWWATLGWILFLSSFLLPIFISQIESGSIIILVLYVAFLLWWLIDTVDQEIPTWMYILGAIMIIFRIIPFGTIIYIASWVLYWTKVRE